MATKSPTEGDRYVGMRIRLRRTLIGMSQERLSEILGMTFQQVQKYERGVNRVGAGRLLDIAAALDVPVSYFFDGYLPSSSTREDTSEIEKLMTTREGIALARAFNRLADLAVRKSFVSFAETVAQSLSAGSDQTRLRT